MLLNCVTILRLLYCVIYSWYFISIYSYLQTLQSVTENRIVCGYTLIKLKVWGKQVVGLSARNAGTCHQNEAAL